MSRRVAKVPRRDAGEIEVARKLRGYYEKDGTPETSRLAFEDEDERLKRRFRDSSNGLGT